MSRATPSVTNFTAGEISPRLEGRTDLSKYFNGCRKLENFNVHPHGGATRRPGFRFVTEAMNPDKPVLLIPFEFNTAQTYVLEFGEDETGQGKMRVFSGHGVVMSGDSEYVQDIPYQASQFNQLDFAQSADVLVLAHPGHPPRTLTRIGHDDWALEEMPLLGMPECWTENNFPSTVCFYEQRLILAGTPDKPGTIWMSRTGEMTDFRLKTREVPLDGWRDREIVDGNSDLVRDGKAGDTFTLQDGDGFGQRDGLKGQHPDGTTRYYRYEGTKNFFTSGSSVTVTCETTPGVNGIEAIWDNDGILNEECWSCFELGERTQGPAGDPPLDDDGIEVTLSGSQANAIEFLVPRSKLWIGTAGGEWTLSGSMGDAVTPATIKANHEGTCGASAARPEPVGFATLYIQRAGSKIREMSYRFESDAYVSRDLTILSEHITQGGLTQMAYVQEPDSVLYCVRGDGTLVALTYVPEQEVAAWSRIITDGAVEAVTSIYSDTEKRDELWMVVRRTVGSVERRYIEFMEGAFDGNIGNGFFVDSGLTYSGLPTQTLQGLDHLAGRTVSVLADGSVQTAKTVDPDGTITLDRPASKVHAGLAYTSLLQPMRVEAGSARGTAQTKKKRITKVSARFHETLGGKIGPDESRLEPVYFRSPATPMGQSPGAWNGDKSVNFPKGWNRDGILTIVQDQPLPMTVLMIVPHVIVNE